MKKILLFPVIVLTLLACNDAKNKRNDAQSPIARTADYNHYVTSLPTATVTTDQRKTIDSLEAVVRDNPGYVVDAATVASFYNNLYDTTGDINALLSFVRFRESAARNTAIKPENSYRLLTQAYIKVHNFKKADSLMKSFTRTYSSPASKMVQFDVAMERGDYEVAKRLLDTLRNTTDYNYLIRAAKYNDYAGDLKNTIALLNQAASLADRSGTKEQQLWVYTNLADYYGHFGEVKKSYEHYLKALKIDPTNTYCLKGIAWIAYSHDRNSQEAARIIHKLKENHRIPDYDLLLAEIYEDLGNTQKAQQHTTAFLKEVATPSYGGMYNLYKIEQWLKGTGAQKQEALALAKTELENRATPETYGYYAMALLATDKHEQALHIVEDYVAGKTFEPVAALQMAQVYKAHGDKARLAALKEELLETSYEMGPVTFLEIKSL